MAVGLDFQPGPTARGAMPIPATVKAATMGTAMPAIGFCLTAVAVISSVPPAAGATFRWRRMPEYGVEDFEMCLIYP